MADGLSRRARCRGRAFRNFCDRTLNLDVESRTLGLPKLAEGALADLSPEDRDLLSAYTRGVNAFIESHRDRLPLELALLRYQPKPWRDFDSVAVALNLATALSQSWGSDLMREHVTSKLGKELAADVFPDHALRCAGSGGIAITDRRLTELSVADCRLPINDTITRIDD